MASYGIHGAVDNYADLPEAAKLDMGTVFLVRQDADAPGGAGMYWVQDGPEGRAWVFLRGVSRFPGDVTANPAGSNVEEPRIMGVTLFDAGEAARVEVGDPWNAVQSACGNNLSVSCYHAVHLIGRRFHGAPVGSPLPFGWPNETPGAINDAGVMVINTLPFSVALIVDGAPDGQEEDLQQWRDNTLAKNVLARVTATGDLATEGGLQTRGKIKLENLPTTDPAEVGVVWNDGGTVKVSAG